MPMLPVLEDRDGDCPFVQIALQREDDDAYGYASGLHAMPALLHSAALCLVCRLLQAISSSHETEERSSQFCIREKTRDAQRSPDRMHKRKQETILS